MNGPSGSTTADDAGASSRRDSSTLEDRLADVGVGLGAGALGYLCYVLWAVVLLTFATPAVGGELTDIHLVLLSPPALGLGMLTGTALYLRFSRDDLSFLDVRTPTPRELLYGVLGALALVAASVAIDWLVAQFGVTPAEHGTVQRLEDADPRVVLYLVGASLVFIGPGEELLFRNVVQKRLSGSFSWVGAIAIASVIFAVVHWEAYATGTAAQRATSLGVVFALSLLLGWLYHRTRNVVVVALAHGGYDAILFATIYAGVASSGG